MSSSTCTKNWNRFGMVLIFLAVLGVLTYRSSNRFVETSSQVARSYQVLEKLEAVQLLLRDNECAVRGFLLTGKDDFLKPLPAIRAKLITGTAVKTFKLEATPGETSFTRTYQNIKVGLLRVSVDLDDDLGTLKVIVHSPDGQTFEWKTSSSKTFEVPETSFGAWTCTITATTEAQSLPFLLTIKQANIPEYLDRLIETERLLTLPEDVRKSNKKKGKFAEELASLIGERLDYSDSIVKKTRENLDAGRALFGEGKGLELTRQIDEQVDGIRALEEFWLRQHLIDVRHSAEQLGETVVGIHFAFVAFVFVGLILVLVGAACRWQWVRNIWFRSIHLAMILIVIVESIFSIECPLTTWEKDLKLAADMQKEEGGFIARWMHRTVFCGWADPEKDAWKFEIGYICFGGLVVASFFLVPPCRRKQQPVCTIELTVRPAEKTTPTG